MRLLVLDADRDARRPVVQALRSVGHAVDEAASADEGEGLARVYPYDALIVDVCLPEGTDAGLRLLHKLRADGLRTPVLLFSEHAELTDRLAGFEAGADDYLAKPFHHSELSARLAAVTRRAQPRLENILDRGPLRVNLDSRCVSVGGQPVHLTAKEFGILDLLARYPGRLFAREEIIAHVWNAEVVADTNVVDVYVWNVRKKLGKQAVQTVRGIGYRFPAGAA